MGSNSKNNKKNNTVEQTTVDVEEAVAPVEAAETIKAEAERLMESLEVRQLWHCLETGYWFTRRDYAIAHEAETKVKLLKFEK